MVVPENDWRCRTCLWTADPTIFTLGGYKSQLQFIHVEEAAIRGCPICNIVVQCVNRLGIKRENNIIEFIKGHYRDPDWFRIQEDPHPPFQVFCSAYDGRAEKDCHNAPDESVGSKHVLAGVPELGRIPTAPLPPITFRL